MLNARDIPADGKQNGVRSLYSEFKEGNSAGNLIVYTNLGAVCVPLGAKVSTICHVMIF